MTPRRLLVHAAFLLLLPVIVAAFGLSVAGSIGLVLLMLLWRWAISLSSLMKPERLPDLQLDTIALSHFVEKVRWCMDRLGLDYVEAQSVGTVGVWLTGRTVPRLRVRTGAVRSSISNSADILRYLWGRYSASSEQAAFLEPTSERLELEHKLDLYGRNIQVWFYYHLPDDRELMLKAWGANSLASPHWQRLFAKACYPLLVFLIRRSFRINEPNYAKAVQRIETLLDEIDTRLADGRSSILGGSQLNFTDLAFAALSAAWLQPDGYGGGAAEDTRLDRSRLPDRMRADIERWIEDYPRAIAFIERLYADERIAKT